MDALSLFIGTFSSAPGVLGSLFLIFPLAILIRKVSLIKGGERADAVVVKTERRKIGPQGSVNFFPIVQYRINGRVHKVRCGFGNKKLKYKNGEAVKILYSKKNAEKIHIIGNKMPFIYASGFGLAGIVLLVMGLLHTLGLISITYS